MSAYALFFRDTQAAIKGQNPNATFGDVSKIVASMWDSLGEEQKQVSSSALLGFPRLLKGGFPWCRASGCLSTLAWLGYAEGGTEAVVRGDAEVATVTLSQRDLNAPGWCSSDHRITGS